MADTDVLMIQDESELRKKLLQMKNGSILTDIMISCGKSTFSAHKCILSNSSLFFCMIFVDKVPHIQSNSEFDQLNMDSVTEDGKVLESVVDYMYSGSINMNEQNFGEIVKIADSLVMRDLTELCLKYLKENLSMGNVLRLYLSVYKCELSLEPSEEILKRLWIFLENSFHDSIIIEDEILQLPVEHVTQILSLGIRKNFNLSNTMKFVQKWLVTRKEDNNKKLLEVADVCMDSCIELLLATPPDQSIEELVECIKDTIDLLQPFKEDSLIDSLLPCAVIEKLEDLKAQLLTGSHGVEDELLPVQDEDNVTDNEEKSSKIQEDQDTDSQSPFSPTVTEDINTKKTTKSLRSSLDKIKVKAFEKSVQERVSIFLEGQISYSHGKTKGRSAKPHTKIKQPTKSSQRKASSKQKIGIASILPITYGKKKAIKRGKASDEVVDESTGGVSVSKRKKSHKNVDYTIDKDDETSACEDSTENGQEKEEKDDKIKTDLSEDDFYRDFISNEGMQDKDDKMSSFLQSLNLSFDSKLQFDGEEMGLMLQKYTQHNECVVCKKNYNRSTHLIRHMTNLHHDVKSWDCGKCSESFNDGKSLLHHSRTHLTDIEEKFIDEIKDIDKTEYICKLCSKKFEKVQSAKAHFIQHKVGFTKMMKTEDPTQEEKIKKESPVKVELKPPTIYPCVECSATFKQRYHLKRHIHCSHSDNFPFQCTICGKKLKMKYQLSEHMTRHNVVDDVADSSEKSVLCYICGATMKSQKYLKRHLDTHSELKRFTCNICHKSYSQAVTLQIHMRKHTGAKPFQCEICSMMFAVKSNMLRHQRRHRGEKRYKCDQCGKGFLMVGDLKRHYTMHTGEKNYACRFCGKRFNCRSKVPQHERIHTGEKPYECRTCGKRFIQSCDRKRHEATHKNQVVEPQRRLTLFEIANPDDNHTDASEYVKSVKETTFNRNRSLNMDDRKYKTEGTSDALNRILEETALDSAIKSIIPTVGNRTSMADNSNLFTLTKPSTPANEKVAHNTSSKVSPSFTSGLGSTGVGFSDGSDNRLNTAIPDMRPGKYTEGIVPRSDDRMTVGDSIHRPHVSYHGVRPDECVGDPRSHMSASSGRPGVYPQEQYHQPLPRSSILNPSRSNVDEETKVGVVRNFNSGDYI